MGHLQSAVIEEGWWGECEKIREESCASELTAFCCTTHQEAVCGKVLRMDCVMHAVTKAGNFISVMGWNHNQFQSFFDGMNSEYADVPYHTEVGWLSQGDLLNYARKSAISWKARVKKSQR